MADKSDWKMVCRYGTKGHKERLLPPLHFMRVQSVNYLGTSWVDFCFYNIQQ
jgi:hypothetical protein